MADPVIGATVQVVLEKLLSLMIEEVKSLRNCKKDGEMLTQNVSLIQAFIHDAERRQVEDQAVEKWLKMLERAAENAENVFDEFRYESIKRQVNIHNNPMKKVGGFFSHTAFKSKMSRKINNINEELRAISQLAKDLGLQSLMVPSRQILSIRETDSVVVASDVVGRDKDVAAIKEKILTMREDIDVCTIPIVGMGGLGKTIVAKRIFNDEQIEKHFEKRVWLCLPEMSETKSFLELILESLKERKIEVQSRDIIVKKLRDELAGRKYLLVLDDLWRVEPTLWHEFLDTLKGINTSRGNCILVTTRMKLVASTVAVGLHMLGKLADDHCWSIFKQRAFVDGEVPEEIVIMENKIVGMCQGLPLAASVLGGLLRNKEKHEWQAILDGNLLVAREDDLGENSIKKILKHSYVYLPSPHLKSEIHCHKELYNLSLLHIQRGGMCGETPQFSPTIPRFLKHPAKNRTTGAMSFVCPSLPRGHLLITLFIISSVSPLNPSLWIPAPHNSLLPLSLSITSQYFHHYFHGHLDAAYVRTQASTPLPSMTISTYPPPLLCLTTLAPSLQHMQASRPFTSKVLLKFSRVVLKIDGHFLLGTSAESTSRFCSIDEGFFLI